jgi:archaellum component FlaC
MKLSKLDLRHLIKESLGNNIPSDPRQEMIKRLQFLESELERLQLDYEDVKYEAEEEDRFNPGGGYEILAYDGDPILEEIRDVEREIRQIESSLGEY